MGTLASDLKHAFRTFRKSPGFTATAVAAIALGIGCNTAIFSVVDAVLLKPLPFPDADRIVVLMNSSPQGNGPAASVPKYNVWRAQTQVLEDVAAYDTGGPGLNLSGGDRPEQIKGIHVSHEFFRLFGAQPAIGRTFTPEEDRPRGGNVAVLSNGIWQRRFGSDPSIVGKDDCAGRRIGHDRRRPRPQIRLRPAARRLPSLSSRPQQHQSGALLSSRGAAQTRRVRRRRQSGHEPCRRTVPPQVSQRHRPAERLYGRAHAATHGAQCAHGSLYIARSRRVRAAHRLRQRRQPAASARRRPVARYRDPLRDRRGTRPDYPRTSDRERAALAHGWCRGIGDWRAWECGALLAVNPGNIPRIGEDGSAYRLNWTVLALRCFCRLPRECSSASPRPSRRLAPI